MSPVPSELQPLTAGTSAAADLHGRVALVTGAGRGIGRAIAEALAEAGADVSLVDLNPPSEAAAAIESHGRRSLALQANVADRENVHAAVRQTLERFGRIDILVNNAGVVERSTLETLDDETFQREIDVIARGTYLFSQAVYDVMQHAGGGKIVNISSISGKLGGAVGGASRGGVSARSGPAYAMAKGGVIAFTKWLAKDAGRYGIQVNAICPGTVASEMTRGYEYHIEAQPIARMGQPQDVAQAAVFLASQMSNYVTGQTLNVDGGVLMD
jgi:3-oxoacyl-[acyl-carrier protein] reductase